MKRTLVLVAALVLVMAFAAPAVAEEVVPGQLPSIITSFKWYDYNTDGNHWWWPNGTESPAAYDEGEGFIPGWKVELLKDGVVIQTAYTGANGWYKFEPVPPGQYLVRECSGGPLWFRTNPVDVDYHVVNVLGDGHTFYCETKFYNVRKCCIGGYTMGYWSNKNGLRDMKAFAPGGVITPEPYGPMTIADIQKLAQQANSVDMCVMLKAQYVAHWLSVNVKGLDYSGYKIGEGLLYDEVMADFIADFPTLCDPANRAKAEFYKNFFDGLNNGKGWRVCTYEEALRRLPVW